MVEDEEGRVCEDAAEARDKAFCEAREIMASEVRSGKLCLACRVDVLDDKQALVLTVPFRDAIEISGN